MSRRCVDSVLTSEYQAILDVMGVGVIVLDSYAKIVWANREAARQLADARLLDESEERTSLLETSRFKVLELLTATKISNERKVGDIGISISLPCVCAKLRLESGVELNVLMLSQRSETRDIAVAHFGKCFGLTDAEAAVLRALARGRRAEEIASDQGVSCATVQTHIRSIYSRCGAQGIGKLLSLENTMPAFAMSA
jgi:DNA-binding CsgD family transcriptional regulator